MLDGEEAWPKENAIRCGITQIYHDSASELPGQFVASCTDLTAKTAAAVSPNPLGEALDIGYAP
jgi:hypothetical protein